jgi:protein-S-isoprenylcysteine O-methyltransferase Ste14
MDATGNDASLVSRTLVLIYGLVSYVIGVAGLAAIIAVLAHVMPFGFLKPAQTAYPILANLLLVALWGAIHSVMARDRFKALISRFIPEPAERPTYVLVAGVTSIALVGYWQPVPGVIWTVTNTTAVALIWAIFAFGWIYLLAATFAINHFDLFGLRQVYLNFANKPRPPLAFVKRAMYSFSRHPIQTGVLIGIWATPIMTATHITLSAGFTAYVFVGLWFEEKDLLRDIGAPYEQYRSEAGMLGPRLFGRR